MNERDTIKKLKERVKTLENELENTNKLLEAKTRAFDHLRKDFEISEKNFREIIENSDNIFYKQDFSSEDIVYMSPSFYRLSGYSVEDLKRMSNAEVLMLFHKDDQEVISRFKEDLKKLADTPGKTISREFRIITKNDGVKWVYGDYKLVLDKKGNPDYVLGVLKDISQIIKNKNEEKKVFHRYETMLSHFPNGAVFLFDKDIRYTMVSGLALKPAGLATEEVIGKTVYEVFPEEVSSVAGREAKKIFNEESVYYEVGFMGRTFANWGVPVKNEKEEISEGLVFAVDITEIKNTEIELENRNRELRKITENIPNVIWKARVDENGKFSNTYISEVVDECLALPKGTINHDWYKYMEYIVPEYIPEILEHIKDGIEKCGKVQTLEYEVIKANGEKAWFLSGGRAYMEDGNAIIYGYTKDNTRRHKTDQELQAQSLMLNEIHDFVTATDLKGNITYVNETVCRELGYSRDELTGKNVSIYGDDPDVISQEQLVEKVNERGSWRGEMVNYTKDRKKIILDSSIKLLKDKSGNPSGLIGVSRDITQQKLDEQILKDSEEKFIKLFLESPLLITLSTIEDGRYIEVNKKFLETTGFKYEEVIGKTSVDLGWIKNEDRKSIAEELKSQGRVKSRVIELKRKNGELVYCTYIGEIIKLKNKEYLLSIAEDVTVKLKAEEEVLKLNQAIEQSPAIIVITNTKGNIVYTNPAFTEITGYKDEDAYGMNPRLLKSGMHDERFYEKLWNTITSGNTWKGEFYNKKKNGGFYWESAVISPIRNSKGEICNFVAIKTDITQEKLIEEELIKAKNRAEESDKLKSSFLSTMSHELRTPLNAVIGFSDILQEQEMDETLMNYVNTINSSGKHLLEIVEDIFEMVALDTGEASIEKAKFEFFEFMAGANELLVETLKYFNKEHINTKCNIPEQFNQVFIKSDRSKLKKVMLNLIKNAVKFTHEGYIETGFAVNGTDLTFYIEDTGIGVDKDEQEVIFDHFRQIEDAHTREYEGIGLGLSICKKIVDMLGGIIQVDSEPGKGTRFSVILNDAVINTKRVKHKEESSSSGKEVLNNRVVLVVEDDKSNMFLIETLFKDTSLKLVKAWDGVEALEKFKSNPEIDLVLMDINLPEMSGLDATREILKINPEIPVIATTAYAYYDDQYNCKDAGCIDFIAKPLNRKELMEKIIKHIT